MSSGVRWTESQYQEYLNKRSANPVKVEQPVRIPRGKTKTEAEFELLLKADWPQMDILFEAVKLKIDDRCWYTPDFFIPQLLTFFEVKGPRIWEDSVVKFKAARVLHSWGVFQMHQKKDGVWNRLH